MHWADVNAKELRRRSQELGIEKHLVATGITPSGHIHVGNMREILTGDIVRRAASDIDIDIKLLYIGDTIDPLRKVYPFLDSSYEQHIGKPLSIIPCPCGNHKSYAEHFLEPFLAAIDELGVKRDVVYSHEMYRDGLYTDAIVKTLNNIDKVRDIIETVSKRQLPKKWFPYNAMCGNPECNSLIDTVSYAYEHPYVLYTCNKCGHEGKADIRKDDGKLPWRIDWPARWAAIGVTCEPFGKDHAAAGGSYETGTRLAKEIFDYEPPHPVIYEWIQLKGKGAMSSSSGVVVIGSDMTKMTPPEVLRFLLTRVNTTKHIDFDPGLGILKLVDDYDRYEAAFFEDEEGDPDQMRALVLAQTDEDGFRERVKGWEIDDEANFKIDLTGQKLPHQIPYRNLVTVSQLAESKEELIPIIERAEKLKFSDLNKEEQNRVWTRIECVRFWLENFAPEDVKFSVQDKVPDEIKAQLDDMDKKRLQILVDTLKGSEWDAENIHTSFYSAGEKTGEKAKPYFRIAYLCLLGKERGPRLGFFLSSLEKDMVIDLLQQGLQ